MALLAVAESNKIDLGGAYWFPPLWILGKFALICVDQCLSAEALQSGDAFMRALPQNHANSLPDRPLAGAWEVVLLRHGQSAGRANASLKLCEIGISKTPCRLDVAPIGVGVAITTQGGGFPVF